MKKVLILSALLILCIGCTRIDNTDDYKVIIDDIIEENNISTNTASMGYKYYLPIGVKKVYDKDYNQIFKVNDTYMYLYVDVISYYYKNNLNLDDKDSSDSYYYYKINNLTIYEYFVKPPYFVKFK